MFRSFSILIAVLLSVGTAAVAGSQTPGEAAVCDDATFLRRLWLTVGGCVPPAGRWQELQEGPLDRAAEVEAALASEAYIRKWGRWLTWFSGCEEEQLSPAGFAMKVRRERFFWAWLKWSQQAVREDRPVDQVLNSLLSANSRGQNESRDTYYARYDSMVELLREGFHDPFEGRDVPNDLFWKSFRSPQENAELICRRMLGFRLECARCHDHPFANWTQEDHNGMSAVFQRVVYAELPTTRSDKQNLILQSGGLAAAFCIFLAGTFVFSVRRGHRQTARIVGFLVAGVAILGSYTAAHYAHLLTYQTSWSREGLVEVVRGAAGDLLLPGSCLLLILSGVILIRNRQSSLAVVLSSLFVFWLVFAFTADAVGGHFTASPSGLKQLSAWIMTPERNDVREIYDDTNGNFKRLGTPRCLDGTLIPDTASDRPRKEFASWLVTESSDQLARNIVNRVTFRMLGIAFVEPVDDFRPGIEIVDEDRLEQLRGEFQENKFSLKWLIRELALSAEFESSSQQHGTLSFRPRPLYGEEIIAVLNEISPDTALKLRDRWTPTPSDPWSCGSFIPTGVRAAEVLVQGQGIHHRENSASFDVVASLMLHPTILKYCRSLAAANSSAQDHIQSLNKLAIRLYGRELSPAEQSIFTEVIADDSESGPANCIWAILNHDDFLVLK